MAQQNKGGIEPLRDRQETFAQLYSTGTYSASEAYRLAGYSRKNADVNSDQLMVKSGMIARIAHIQAKRAKKREITAESLADEYDEARQVGKDTQQASSMVSATSGKARLYGLDKQVIEQSAHKDLTTTEAEQAREYAEFVRWKANKDKGHDGRSVGEITAPGGSEGRVVGIRGAG